MNMLNVQRITSSKSPMSSRGNAENIPQVLNLVLHAEKKIFNVSVHDATPENLPRVSLRVYIHKAKYHYDKILGLKTKNGADLDDRALNSGFVMALVNTNYEGWTEQLLTDANDNNQFPNVASALIAKEAVINELEKVGWRNVGARVGKPTNKGDGNGGIRWSTKFNPNNMTREKIYDKIEFINVSLQLDIPLKVKSAAYWEVVAEDNRKTVSYPVNSLGTLLRFVREQMGLV